MATGTREIRRKIKSIKNTRQITKAMELVSASKMRRAVANTTALRPYARLARALLQTLSEKTSGSTEHPMFATREVKRALIIAIGSDRGLCGSLNAQLVRKINEYILAERKKKNPPELSFIAIGKKAQDFLRRMDQKIIAAFPAMSTKPTLKDTLPISRLIFQDYGNGQYDKVVLIYTDFVSALVQKPVLHRLLPFSRSALEEMVEELESTISKKSAEETPEFLGEATGRARRLNEGAPKLGATERRMSFIKCEPSPQIVFEMLLPRLTEMQIYQSVLEAAASEHSARMLAMRNATDNATEFIDDLTLAYNQIRQATITRELAEISAGRAALE